MIGLKASGVRIVVGICFEEDKVVRDTHGKIYDERLLDAAGYCLHYSLGIDATALQ
jgi:hypothetical protein